MRALALLLLFAGMAAATSAAAMPACEPAPPPQAAQDDASPIVPGSVDGAVDVAPVPLAELASDSPWLPRIEAAADELLAALKSRDVRRWKPLLGGRWLGAGDQRAIERLLDDRCSAFAAVLAADTPPARKILGWTVPTGYSADERAEIAARPGTEALVCWSAKEGGDRRWPRTAAEADNARGRGFACARIVHSSLAEAPGWRAFIELPAEAGGV